MQPFGPDDFDNVLEWLLTTLRNKAYRPGFILVQHLRGTVVPFGDLLFINVSTNARDDHKYSLFPSQILTLPKFWYHLAHSFSRKNVPFV